MEITVTGGTLPQKEIDRYIEEIKQDNPDKTLKKVEIEVQDKHNITIKYTYDSKPFNRIRRITGYLVGDIDRFNNAKRAEVNDRVKHTIGSASANQNDQYIGKVD